MVLLGQGGYTCGTLPIVKITGFNPGSPNCEADTPEICEYRDRVYK